MPEERIITFGEAVREALAEEMTRDSRVFMMGEDIGNHGSVFKILEGLLDQFGPERVRDTPISEAGFAGSGVGAALAGMRPVVDIMFGDFATLAMDQLVNQAAKIRYMSGGQAMVPLTVHITMGAGRSSAAQHSQSLHAWFAHIPGLKVVLPSTPYDAKGLLKTAIRDDNPVIVFEHKMMYRQEGPVPEKDYTIPLGEADIKREGDDVTIVATSSMVYVALDAATELEKEGISAEVIDPRSLVPLDRDTLVASASKTGRVVIVDEGCRNFGITAQLAATITEGAFDYLDAPVTRIAAMDVPVPFSPSIEFETIPNKEKVLEGVRSLFQQA